MTTINPYLTFNGNCEEAFNLYKAVFGGEFTYIGRYGEMPPQAGMPDISEEQKNKIMHISLPISKETILMGSDPGGGWAADYKEGTNFSISINTDNIKEADRLFSGLSNEGKVFMPMNKTFWGSYFGMLTDKFGINWMISANVK
ncbi:MAG: VOC family protein [Flammeovirgaceae bacterium]|nr:VOC family protein [Flammeovirgaceae bacterium]